ncbi:MAG: hypothetical protein IPN95_00210 [Bacteroidetes bacterium]|nr:hypothetical protein [Bacteroidota bacterium]
MKQNQGPQLDKVFENSLGLRLACDGIRAFAKDEASNNMSEGKAAKIVLSASKAKAFNLTPRSARITLARNCPTQ